jgi:di/tricarboxylate transporter
MNPIPEEEATPHLKGGLDALGRQLDKMGPVSASEKRALLIFGAVIFLWCTDRWHQAMFGFQIDPTVTAILGAIVCLLPKVGILAWNEADIPWHLMLFSAGAYAGGMALEDTGAARWAVGRVFTLLNIGQNVPFFTVYLAVIAVMMYSHLFFTSKNMRTLIMLPFVILMARQLGIKPLALALPAAFTIDWVIGLPISAKPNVILFSTGQFSVIDNLKFALIVATFGVFLLAVAGVTWFRFLGITP